MDTPGHEAFSKMRTRGATVADIAILVVAADDGVQPQTIEAYAAIKEANLPFIVAINKMDKPGADPKKIKTQLAESGIYVEGYGGNIPCAKISAKTGEGAPELLEVALILADMENLQADANQNAIGVVIESNMDSQRGISSTLLIKNGTMKKRYVRSGGPSSGSGKNFGKFLGQPIDEASFSSPVRIIGFSELPAVGDEFKTYADKNEVEEALIKTEEKLARMKNPDASVGARRREKQSNDKMIIKTDTAGSLEALEKELMKTKDEEISIELLKGGVGNINEDDAEILPFQKIRLSWGSMSQPTLQPKR